jgi:hypothetical protein
MTCLVKFKQTALPAKTVRQRTAEEMAGTGYGMKCALKAHSASPLSLCDPLRKVELSTGVDLGKHSGIGIPVLAFRITNFAASLSHMLRTVPALPKATACALLGSAVKE